MERWERKGGREKNRTRAERGGGIGDVNYAKVGVNGRNGGREEESEREYRVIAYARAQGKLISGRSHSRILLALHNRDFSLIIPRTNVSPCIERISRRRARSRRG